MGIQLGKNVRLPEERCLEATFRPLQTSRLPLHTHTHTFKIIPSVTFRTFDLTRPRSTPHMQTLSHNYPQSPAHITGCKIYTHPAGTEDFRRHFTHFSILENNQVEKLKHIKLHVIFSWFLFTPSQFFHDSFHLHV